MSDASDHRFPRDGLVEPDTRPAAASERRLGDFTTSRSVLAIGLLAVLIGALVAFLALGLLDLIGLITHLAYTGTARDGDRSS